MPNVYSAVLEIDTRYNQNVHATATLAQKVAYLTASLGDAMQGFTQLNNNAPPSSANGDILIFTAPEYYFGHPQFDADFSVFAYDMAEQAQADAGCVQASQQYRDMLIVPGTVLYKTTVNRAQRGQIHTALQQGKATFQHATQTNELTRVQKLIVPKGKGLKSALSPWARLRAIGYNQARVYHNGARVYTLDKMDNAEEFVNEPGGRPILIPGTQTGVFTHPADPNVTVGLEICADQGRIESAQLTVDILILVAAFIPLANSFQPVRANGLAIHAPAHQNFQTHPGGMVRIRAMNVQGRIFDTDAQNRKRLQDLMVNAVRCQVKNL